MEEQIGLDTTYAAVSTPHTTLVDDQGKRVEPFIFSNNILTVVG